MSLAVRSHNPKVAFYSPNLDSPQPLNADISELTVAAIEAYNQGLLDVHYFKDGWKQTVKNSSDIPHLMRNGFRLQQVNGKFYLTRGLLGGTPPDELAKKLNNKLPGQKSIFISYSWKQQDIARDIDAEFEKKGYLVIRDEKDLSVGDDLKEFMDFINHPNLDYVLVILSDSYLKGPNCMYEINQIMRRYKFHDTLLTYVMTDDDNTKADIYGGIKKYEDFWQSKLSSAQNTSNTADAKKITTMLEDCRTFTKNVMDKIHLREDVVKKMNGYKVFVDTIEEKEKGKEAVRFQKLEQLKERALKDEEVQKSLASYIPVLGSRCLFEAKEQTFDLDQVVNDFLKGDRKVFLLLGNSGGGKSTYLRYLENRLWKEWAPGKPIPLYINLPALKLPFQNAIGEALAERGLNEAEQKELKNKHSFLFLMDGYDELKQKKNLYERNHLDQWNAKTIITCRTQYLAGEQSSYQNYFAPQEESLISDVSLDEASISPFTPDQIKAYSCKFIEVNKIPRTWEQYKADFNSIPDLAEIIETPFLLRIILEVLPSIIGAHQKSISQEELKLLRIEIFDAFVNNWFSREERRIQRMDTEIDIPDLKEAFAAFAQRLAIEMVQDDVISVDYKESSDVFDQTPSKWDKYFRKDPKLLLVRSGVPLRKIGPHSYAFIHKSLLEYFSARAIIKQDSGKSHPTKISLQQPQQGLSSSSSSSSSSASSTQPKAPFHAVSYDNLSKKLLTKEPEIIQLLAECVTKDPSLKNQLFEFIELSKTDPTASIAAANAITILNASEVNLSKRDFKGVRIAGADLSGAILTSTNLSYADLKNVLLTNAILDYSTIAFSETAGLELGQKPFIHTPPIDRMAISSDGKWILTTNECNTIRLWDFQTGNELESFLGNGDKVQSVAISLDGKWALSGGYDNKFRLCDCKTGEILQTFAGECIVNISAISPDGKWILTADGSSIHLWDSKTGKKLRTFLGHMDSVNSLAFSPDGKWALSGSGHPHYSKDNSVRLWDCQTGKELRSFLGHSSHVNSVAFSPDGKWALSGSGGYTSEDSSVRLWDCQTGKELQSFLGLTYGVNTVAFSPNGKWALSGGNDKTVRLWDCKTGKELRSFLGLQDAVRCVTFSPDGKWAISAGYDEIRIWNISIPTNQKIKRMPYCTDMSVSLDSKWALSGGSDNTVRLWDSHTGKELRSFIGHKSYVNSVAISPDGKWALSGGPDQTIRLWDCQTGKELRSFGCNGTVYSVAFSPDGKWAISGGGGFGGVRLWDCQTGKELQSFLGDCWAVKSLAFSPNGKWVLSGDDDNKVHLWECQTGNKLRTFIGHKDDIRCVAFSPDGKWALSGSGDYTSKDSSVRLWDCQTGKELQSFLGHSARVNGIDFSPDGKWALSGSSDSTVRLWDCHTGKELHCLTLGYGIVQVKFLHGGKSIIVLTEQPALQVWDLFDDKLHLQPSLKWSTGSAILSAQNLNMEGIKGLTENNQRLLLQHGAQGKSEIK